MNAEEEFQSKRKNLARAWMEYYFALPMPKQILAWLLFSMACAIIFQMAHGFDVLCKSTGGMVCIATEYKKADPVIEALARIDKKVDAQGEKIDETGKRVLKIEKSIDLMAGMNGTKERIRRRLRPQRDESLFGVNNQ